MENHDVEIIGKLSFTISFNRSLFAGVETTGWRAVGTKGPGSTKLAFSCLQCLTLCVPSLGHKQWVIELHSR